jgi:hypothetical protein
MTNTGPFSWNEPSKIQFLSLPSACGQEKLLRTKLCLFVRLTFALFLKNAFLSFLEVCITMVKFLTIFLTNIFDGFFDEFF